MSGHQPREEQVSDPLKSAAALNEDTFLTRDLAKNLGGYVERPQAARQASAALAALAITPVAIVLALTAGPRLRALLRHQAPAVRGAMLWTVVANLSAVALGIIGLSADTETDPIVALRVLTVAVQFAALLAMLRLVWFFVSLLALNEFDQEATSEQRRPV